ncbi:hypothetical protein Cgig2_003372 [Carnegiea gigantea]|uniref:DUF4283 domain-containing protein n=1 Tax=Carnegiea gigantea TaxID=171969 RepID=A0A9Q1JHQ0_9CARY|nr:hypothetical protein Cgig2_003372 [Carnegiea gigantea]
MKTHTHHHRRSGQQSSQKLPGENLTRVATSTKPSNTAPSSNSPDLLIALDEDTSPPSPPPSPPIQPLSTGEKPTGAPSTTVGFTKSQIEYWEQAIICKVLGANPPFAVMEGFFKRIWKAFEIDRILLVKRGMFLVQFTNLHDKQVVEKRGMYFFDNKPLLVKGWNAAMDLQTDSITSLPIWVHFPNLDLRTIPKS